MDQDWHSGHFCCWNCDLNLTGHRYILREEHPYCIKCYENLFANTCEECKTPIGTDSKVRAVLYWYIGYIGFVMCFCRCIFFIKPVTFSRAIHKSPLLCHPLHLLVLFCDTSL